MRHIVRIAVLLAACTAALAEDDAGTDARSVAEQYAAAAMAGEIEAAAQLAVRERGSGDAAQIKDFQAVIAAKPLKMKTVWADDLNGRAIAVTGEVRIAEADPDGQDCGFLILELVRSEGRWLVDDVDFRSEAKKDRAVAEFKKVHPDAREFPSKPST